MRRGPERLSVVVLLSFVSAQSTATQLHETLRERPVRVVLRVEPVAPTFRTADDVKLRVTIENTHCLDCGIALYDRVVAASRIDIPKGFSLVTNRQSVLSLKIVDEKGRQIPRNPVGPDEDHTRLTPESLMRLTPGEFFGFYVFPASSTWRYPTVKKGRYRVKGVIEFTTRSFFEKHPRELDVLTLRSGYKGESLFPSLLEGSFESPEATFEILEDLPADRSSEAPWSVNGH